MPTLYLVLSVLAVGLGSAALIVLFVQAEKDRKARLREEQQRQRAISRRWDGIVAKLLENPSSKQDLEDALVFVNSHRGYLDVGYRMALDLVALSAGARQTKVFALKVGRQYYSQNREGRVPTIYDEAAIENDIQARC